MRILLINDYGALTGGAEQQIVMLREQFRHHGHDVRLFSSSARHLPLPILSDYQCRGTTQRLQTLLMTANPSAFFRLRRVLEEFQPQIVHVKLFLWQLSPLILPLLKGIPSLYHVVNYQSICPLGLKMLPNGRTCTDHAGIACYQNRCLTTWAWVPLMLQRRLFHEWKNVFRILVANSHAVARRLTAEGLAPIQVIWNGVPVAPRRPPLSSPPTIGFAGRLVWEKGVDVLVRAFAQVKQAIPDARLVLAGEGPERMRLTRQIERLGLAHAVSLLGHLSSAEMARHFSSVWVQVVPSRWEETFGLVAAEAMMRGTAVVASSAGALSEIVRDGDTGILVPPENHGALAQALVNLLGHRERAEAMGEASRRVALEHLRESTCANKFLTLYEKLLDKS